MFDKVPIDGKILEFTTTENSVCCILCKKYLLKDGNTVNNKTETEFFFSTVTFKYSSCALRLTLFEFD